MKRYSIAACILVACTVLLAGQAMSQMEFGVGPVIGLNFGSVSYTPTPVGFTLTGHTGVIFGAQAELGFAKMFYVVLEPTYIVKGFGATLPQGTVTVTGSELQFPVLFKVKFMKGVIRPYAFAGPNIGFVLSATESFAVTGATIPDKDLKATTSSTDFALDFGGGAEYNVTPKIGITLDLRYSLGLSNMNSDPANTATTFKLSGFEIEAGVMFHIM